MIGHNVCVQALLGKVYEEQGRLVRAYSRYRQAYQLLEPYLTLLDSCFRAGAAGTVQSEGLEVGPTHGEEPTGCCTAIRPQVEAGLARLEPKISADAKEMLDAK